jgi:site-specific DNA-methyltransferase (adenine-specific)
MEINKIYPGEALEILKSFPDESIDMVITSPPYWGLRDYGHKKQLGREKTFEEYIDNLIKIFDEVKRVLKKEGTCWVNIGDVYSGTGNKKDLKDPKYKEGRNGQKIALNNKTSVPKKSLCMIPERFAIAMISKGWILRNQIIWNKPNVMPQSVSDRFTVDFEKLFFFSRSNKYYFEQQKEESIWKDDPRCGFGRLHYRGKKRDGQKGTGQENFVSINKERNMRTTWKISTRKFKGAHFAVFPETLIKTPIKAGCPEKGIVLDIFMGSGTTAKVSKDLNRNYIGIELNPDYINMINERLQ